MSIEIVCRTLPSLKNLRLARGTRSNVVAKIVAGASLLLAAMSMPSVSHANEVMTDRCSADVAIVPHYNDPPNQFHAIVLIRDASGSTPWSQPFKVDLSGDGFVRWWCHSTSGNWLDPGTWRIDELILGTACKVDANFENPTQCRPSNPTIQGHIAQTNGWTAERSRCDSRSNVMRARLGPDRLLQIECLPSDTGVAMQALSAPTAAASSCYNSVQNTIAWDYSGSTSWSPGNVNTLCAGAENLQEPGWCFVHTMFDNVDWGGGTQWYWGNAVNLCKGTHDAAGTIACFRTMISWGYGWPDAINLCQPDYRPITIAGYCLDVTALDDWSPVQLAYCNGGNTQLWERTPMGILRNLGNPEKCLDVRYGATDNGTPMQVYQCNSTAAQNFYFDGILHSGLDYNKCVDVPYAQFYPGAQPWLWDCNWSSAQTWSL